MGVMNELIDPQAVGRLVRILAEATPAVRWARTAAAAAGLGDLNLRARTDLVAGTLVADVTEWSGGKEYTTAAGSFRAALSNPEFTGWILWPVSEAAVSLALESGALEDFDDCLALLAELTPRLTGEFAIRRLLARDPDRALALLGFTPASVSVTGPRLDQETLAMPGELTFAFEISNTGAQDVRLAVDYLVHYRKANGGQTVKVFKISTLTLAPGESRSLSKRHAFRQMTTRVHHPGLHALELQINGAVHGRTEFLLETVQTGP
jgi:hypothetical protein